jgi:hypothetical protein
VAVHIARCARNLLTQRTFGVAASSRGLANTLIDVLVSPKLRSLHPTPHTLNPNAYISHPKQS